MADHPRSDVAVAGGGQSALSATGLQEPAHAGHHGRPISWAAVGIIMVGFLAGGLGLMIGPTWWLFWAGTGLAAFGGVVALATGIFNDWY